MRQNAVYLVAALALVAVGAGGYWYYQKQQQQSGVEINVGGRSLTIQTR